MKNRYFGDIYDYIKYALIRQLTDLESAETSVCWMLTPDEAGEDGQHTNYLMEVKKWGSFDPELFEFLRHQLLDRRRRTAKAIERSNLLQNCRFYSRILADDPVRRYRYFDRFLGFAQGSPLVFFDPDNGIEVKSVKYGGRNSSKYLFWSEIEQALRANHSLLIYQHLPPKPRSPLIRHVTRRLVQVSRSRTAYSIRTGKVAFFLVPRWGNIPQARRVVSAVERTWQGVLKVSEHGSN